MRSGCAASTRSPSDSPPDLSLGKRERKQLIHYLKASGFPRGLLLNFGAEVLEIERAIGPTRLAKLSPDSVPSQEAQQLTQA